MVLGSSVLSCVRAMYTQMANIILITIGYYYCYVKSQQWLHGKTTTKTLKTGFIRILFILCKEGVFVSDILLFSTVHIKDLDRLIWLCSKPIVMPTKKAPSVYLLITLELGLQIKKFF